jgi:hypothetical protein
MDETLCPKCKTPLRAGASFCNKCGASLSVKPKSSERVFEKEPAHGDGEESPKRSQSIVPAVNGSLALFRQSVSWGQRIWDIITIGGCTGVAGLWYWYSGMAETAPDYKTCAATVLLPLVLIIFRPQIDRVLLPIQKIRRKIPPLVRLGAGLAMPFLISNYLYAKGFTEFDFMFKTVVLSTLSSFVILHNPVVPRPNPMQRGLQ